MSLKRYNVDLRKLSLNERENVYDILEKQSFITTIDLKNIGVYDVFWDSSTSIEESITFPSESIITQI